MRKSGFSLIILSLLFYGGNKKRLYINLASELIAVMSRV